MDIKNDIKRFCKKETCTCKEVFKPKNKNGLLETVHHRYIKVCKRCNVLDSFKDRIDKFIYTKVDSILQEG